jgi:hypothetical protein
MKQLVLGSVMLVAACQSATSTSTIEQEVGDLCSVQGPPAQPWKGGGFPPSSDTTTIVLLDYDNYSRAYAADPVQDKIHWVFELSPGHTGKFLAETIATGRNHVSIRNPPPPRCPPGPCGDDWFAFAVARRFENLAFEAEIDLDACYQK